MNNSILKRTLIGLCALLTAVGIIFLVFSAVSIYKEEKVKVQNEYEGYTKRYPISNVSLMIPDEFETVVPENIDVVSSGESMVVPYDEYYTWKNSTYTGMISVSKETTNMEPRAYMEVSAIPTYEEYYSELGFEVISREAGTIADYPAAALTFKYTVNYELGVNKTFYAYSTYIQDSGYIYITTCVCEDWDFERCKPIFEKITTSIKIGDIKT